MFKICAIIHELIPQASGDSYTHWHLFVDYSLVFSIVVYMLLPIRERIIMSRAPPPYFARRYPSATRWGLNLFRALLLAWSVVFFVGIFRIRYHYGADVFVSIFITLLIVCNEKMLQAMVPYLYLPVDARYADAPAYPYSIDPQLYEETLSKIGVGGII